jgi:hypothetical protein
VAHHRLAHCRHGPFHRGQEPVAADPDLVVLGLELAGHEVGVEELVAALAAARLEPDAERGEPALPLLGQQRHDVAGVDAAGQQHPDRHVSDHPPLDRQLQLLVQGLRPFRLGQAGVPGERRLPVHVVARRPVRFDRADRGRRQLAHPGQDRPRRRHHRVERHVVLERHPVDRRVHLAGRQQRRQRRRETQPPRRLGQVHRLDAEPVAGQDDASGSVLDQREREHPEEVRHAVGAPAVVRLDDHLGVRGGEEPVAGRRESGPQLLVVVDAAVEDQGEPQLLVGHRLPARLGQVDDLQTAVAERDRAALGEPGTVRSA